MIPDQTTEDEQDVRLQFLQVFEKIAESHQDFWKDVSSFLSWIEEEIQISNSQASELLWKDEIQTWNMWRKQNVIRKKYVKTNCFKTKLIFCTGFLYK